MIGYSHKFVFVHIPKTAGKSVRTALRPYSLTPRQRAVDYTVRRFSKLDMFGYNAGGTHGTAQEICDAIGSERFTKFFKFSFVRNPWDHAVSAYHFQKTRPKSQFHDIAINGSLTEFVRARVESKSLRQIDYLQDAQGNLLVDFVGRLENIESDFAHICQKIGAHTNLTHKNKTNHRSYQEEHTAESRALIEEYYAADAEAFGYSFD